MKQPLKLVVSRQCVTAVCLAFEQQEESHFSPLPFVRQPGFCLSLPRQTLSLALCHRGPISLPNKAVITGFMYSLCDHSAKFVLWGSLTPTLDCPLIRPFTTQTVYFVLHVLLFLLLSFSSFALLWYFFSFPLGCLPCLSTTLGLSYPNLLLYVIS